MKNIINDPLLTAGRAMLYLVLGLIGFGCVALVAGIALVLTRPGYIFEELSDKVPIQPGMTEAWLFAGSFAIIIVLLVLMFFFFRHTLRIIDSVGQGDPFAPANAERLTAMAWLMLVVQALTIPAGGLIVALTNALGEDPGTVDAGPNFNGLLLVIILFILARVFKHGTRMREDLEGTV
jgi:hypothetical protein